MELYGKSRSDRTERNSWPTAPVTPTTAIVGAFSWSDIRTLPGDAYFGLGWLERVAEKKLFWRRRESEAIGIRDFRERKGLYFVLERERERECEFVVS